MERDKHWKIIKNCTNYRLIIERNPHDANADNIATGVGFEPTSISFCHQYLPNSLPDDFLILFASIAFATNTAEAYNLKKQ